MLLPIKKRVVGGEYSTALIVDERNNIVIAETIFFSDDDCAERAIRTVLNLRDLQAEHIAELVQDQR